MEEKTVSVPLISCHHCVKNISREVGEVEGVQSVAGDPAKKQVTVRFQSPASWEQIARVMADIGYPPG